MSNWKQPGDLRETEAYRSMTMLHAVETVEYDGGDAEEWLPAWQYLYDHGAAAKFQGWYGRRIADLLAGGFIKE